MNWDKLDPKLRERLIRDNPRDIGPAGLLPKPASGALGALPDSKPQQDPLSALDQGPKTRARSQSRVACVITLVSFRHGRIDPGNIEITFKGLQDAIACSLGIDDGDRRLRWQYEQVRTGGATGTLVIIETKARR